MKAVKPSCGLF